MYAFTEREVHAVRGRRRPRDVRPDREARAHRTRDRTPRSDDESLRSFIRVSQVYP